MLALEVSENDSSFNMISYDIRYMYADKTRLKRKNLNTSVPYNCKGNYAQTMLDVLHDINSF